MNILALADQEDKYLWDNLDKNYLKSADLIISAGDLKREYLEFLCTFTTAPVVYVYGNHDRTKGRTGPEGCECAEDKIITYNGIRILGLGGSIRYRPDCLDMYTEAEMEKRIKKLRFKLKRSKGFDILLTHAPAFELGDDTDFAHRGFKCFRDLLDEYKPKYMIHGHVHLNYGRKERILQYGDTTIINAFEKHMFEY